MHILAVKRHTNAVGSRTDVDGSLFFMCNDSDKIEIFHCKIIIWNL